MESVGFQLQQAIAGIGLDLNMAADKVRLDGQLGRHLFVMQHLADMVLAQVTVATTKEVAALGVAMGAGHTREINVWRPFCMAEEHGRIYNPRIRVDDRNARIAEWKRAVNRSSDWARPEYKYSNLWLTLPFVLPAFMAGAYVLFKRFGNFRFSRLF